MLSPQLEKYTTCWPKPVWGTLGHLWAWALAGGADCWDSSSESPRRPAWDNFHHPSLHLHIFASLLYMKRTSGEEGRSQEALRGPLGPVSGHRTVWRSEDSTVESIVGDMLRAGTGERSKRIPKGLHKLVNDKGLGGAGVDVEGGHSCPPMASVFRLLLAHLAIPKSPGSSTTASLEVRWSRRSFVLEKLLNLSMPQLTHLQKLGKWQLCRRSQLWWPGSDPLYTSSWTSAWDLRSSSGVSSKGAEAWRVGCGFTYGPYHLLPQRKMFTLQGNPALGRDVAEQLWIWSDDGSAVQFTCPLHILGEETISHLGQEPKVQQCFGLGLLDREFSPC